MNLSTDLSTVCLAVACVVSGCSQSANEPTNALLGHEDQICSLAFSPDGSKLVSGSADSSIRIWDIATRECLHVLNQPNDWVHCVDVAPNGVQFASCGRDEKVRIWSLDTGNLEKELDGHKGIIFSVRYSDDGDHLISYGQDKTIRIWDVTSGACESVTLVRTFWTPSGFALIPNTALVVLAGDEPVVWDLDQKEAVQTLVGHQDSVGSIAVSGDGRYIASGGKYQDHSLRYWIRDSAECLWSKDFGTNNGVEAILFSPNDDVMVSGHFSGAIVCWEPTTGEELRRTTAHAYLDALALSGDLILASAGRDNSAKKTAIKLWQLDSLAPFNPTAQNATEQ